MENNEKPKQELRGGEKFVVTQGGKRVDGNVHESAAAAATAAAGVKKVNESAGQKVEVKRQLHG